MSSKFRELRIGAGLIAAENNRTPVDFDAVSERGRLLMGNAAGDHRHAARECVLKTGGGINLGHIQSHAVAVSTHCGGHGAKCAFAPEQTVHKGCRSGKHRIARWADEGERIRTA